MFDKKIEKRYECRKWRMQKNKKKKKKSKKRKGAERISTCSCGVQEPGQWGKN